MSMLGLEEPPRALLLRGTRNLRTAYGQYSRSLLDARELRLPNGLLEDTCTGMLGQNPVVYASVYGAPMAAELVHVAGMIGVPLVVHTGSFGALSRQLNLGNLLAVTEAGCGEGVSQYYHQRAERFQASVYGRKLEGMTPAGELTFGPIFSTSALLAESRELLRGWADQGYLGVDMETSAVFAVAEHFGMDRVSILYASDHPLKEQHLLAQDPETERLRARGSRYVMELAFRLVSDYCSVKPT